MASSSRKNNKCVLSEGERPRFYKIILDDTIREKKLSIPRKFVRNYGHLLSSRVMLKVPSGMKWQVDIVRSNSQIWLQKGWPEFADYYSVAHSYFLLFEYEKNNGDFTVIIFDKTAIEIDYSFSFSNEPNIVDGAEDDDVSLEILDHFSPSRQEKVKSQILLPTSPHKIKPKCSAKTFDPHCPINEVEGMQFLYISIRLCSTNQKHLKFYSTSTEIDYTYTFFNEVAAEPQVPKDESDGIPVEISYQFSPSRKRKEKSPTPSSSWSHKTIKIVEDFTNVTGKGTEKKENRSFQKEMGARSCSQPQIPTFEIKMKPSHILDRKSTPDIAASFALKYMKRDGNALLNVLDGRTWSLKYSSTVRRTGVRRTRFMHWGWNKFVKGNYLQLGDVCKFELIDPHKVLFRVVISRSTTGGISGSSSKQSLGKETSSKNTEAPRVEFF